MRGSERDKRERERERERGDLVVMRPNICWIVILISLVSVGGDQCDQIGRFFALWATIQSPWQQLYYPNRPHC